MSGAPSWRSINEAPKDGTPVFAKGNNYGKPECGVHCCWAYFKDGQWHAADGENLPLEYLTEYLVRPAVVARVATPNGRVDDLKFEATARN